MHHLNTVKVQITAAHFDGCCHIFPQISEYFLPTCNIQLFTGTKEQIHLAKTFILDIVERCKLSDSNINSKLAKREPRVSPKASANKLQQIPRVEKISSVSGT